MKGYQQNSNKPATWQTDLQEAHQLEDKLSQILIDEFGAVTVQAPKDKSFPDYDLLMILDNEGFKIELKQDKNIRWSKNLAVEIGRTVNGEFRPTGIASSKADVFVYFFNDQYYFIHTCQLKEMVQKAFKTKGGDGGRAHIALIPQEQFLKTAINLKTFTNE